VETRVYEDRLGPGEASRLMAQVVFDLRNRAWLCGAHHAKHHDGSMWRIPLVALPVEAELFAAELGPSFVDQMMREYA
jgi:hypothetical protein